MLRIMKSYKLHKLFLKLKRKIKNENKINYNSNNKTIVDILPHIALNLDVFDTALQ